MTDYEKTVWALDQLKYSNGYTESEEENLLIKKGLAEIDNCNDIIMTNKGKKFYKSAMDRANR